MSLTISSSIPSPATLEKPTKPQSASGNGVKQGHLKTTGSSVGTVNDNVSLSKAGEIVPQDIERIENDGAEVRETPVLDAEGALKAMRMVQNGILHNAKFSLQSQANQTPTAVADLLSNDAE